MQRSKGSLKTSLQGVSYLLGWLEILVLKMIVGMRKKTLLLMNFSSTTIFLNVYEIILCYYLWYEKWLSLFMEIGCFFEVKSSTIEIVLIDWKWLIFQNLVNYFRFHTCLSMCATVRQPHLTFSYQFLHVNNKMSRKKIICHDLRVKNMHFESSSDASCS